MNDQIERAGDLWQDILANNLTSDSICSECCFGYRECNERKEVCFEELCQAIERMGNYVFNIICDKMDGIEDSKTLNRKRPMLPYQFQ